MDWRHFVLARAAQQLAAVVNPSQRHSRQRSQRMPGHVRVCCRRLLWPQWMLVAAVILLLIACGACVRRRVQLLPLLARHRSLSMHGRCVRPRAQLQLLLGRPKPPSISSRCVTQRPQTRLLPAGLKPQSTSSRCERQRARLKLLLAMEKRQPASAVHGKGRRQQQRRAESSSTPRAREPGVQS